MAKIKYSALVSDMRGKLNGSVASKNRFGSYYRNKVTPVNPQSSFQQNARQRFGALSSQFKDLTLSQINAWNEAAQNFPVTNIFGDQVFLTGQMLYNRLNGNLAKLGIAPVQTAPAPASFPEFGISTGVADISDGLVSILLTGISSIPAGMSMVVYATRPVPLTKSFLKNEYRFIGQPDSVTNGSADISAVYTDRFGNFAVGQKIGVRVALVKDSNGQQSVPAEYVIATQL